MKKSELPRKLLTINFFTIIVVLSVFTCQRKVSYMKTILPSKQQLLHGLRVFLLLLGLVILALLIGRNNSSWYKTTIGKITSIQTKLDTDKMTTDYSNDKLYQQTISVEILNGDKNGEVFTLTNQFSETTAIEEHYRIFDQLFLELVSQDKINIIGVKRDSILLLCFMVFVALAIYIGKRKGSMAILSIGINILIVVITIPLIIKWENPLILGISCAVVFTFVSFLCIHGLSKQCSAGILSTMVSLLISVTLAFLVLRWIRHNTLDYDQMNFLTYISPEQIFMIEIILGGLGAIIDIANTMNTAIRELCLQSPSITADELWEAGMEIGKDIMGTMTNVLFFVFLAGSIPNTILWYCNHVPMGDVLNHYLSLEIARALTGGISVILSIPITLLIAIIIQKGVPRWRSILH